jgi:putative ABC transport system permease protein
MQFVIEAVLLASVGGVIGVALGFGATALGRFLDFPAEVPMWVVALGLGVSSGIGLVAGIYPAWRASRLDPAVALRVE